MSSPGWKKVHWIYWLALLWFSVYLLLTLSWWQQNIKEREQIQHIEQLLPWIEPVQQLVKQLQAERGLSCQARSLLLCLMKNLPYKFNICSPMPAFS